MWFSPLYRVINGSWTHSLTVISDLVKTLSESHPIISAFGPDGPFTTSYEKREFMKKHFSVVEPKAYIVDHSEGKTLQY